MLPDMGKKLSGGTQLNAIDAAGMREHASASKVQP
jgi:hypothetical protein